MLTEERRVVCFLVGAYAWTWMFGFPCVAQQDSAVLKDYLMVFLGIGAFGPTISAFVVQYFFDGGRNGVLKLVHRCNPSKIPRTWMIYSFLSMPVMLGFTSAMYVWFGGPPPKQKSLVSFITVFLISFPVGSLGEEFGWRGIMLPDMFAILDRAATKDPNQQWRWSPVVASAIIGVFWAIWHLPAFFVKDLTQSRCNFGQFVIQEMLYSVFYTLCSNHTENSILAAIIMHASINTFGALIPWGDVEYPNFTAMPNSIQTIVMFIGVVLLIFAVGPELGRPKQIKGPNSDQNPSSNADDLAASLLNETGETCRT
jgi:membrane protease YdiL (CAAX protease family)